ncbi:MAG: hypothetical protein ACE5OZ_01100 [Candidatus Heimdallarchaeota archaeon]
MEWPLNINKHLFDPSPTNEKITICNCPQDGELLYNPATDSHIYKGCCREGQICAIVAVAKHLAYLERNNSIFQRSSSEAS